MGIPFDVEEATQILARTPRVLRALLAGLPEEWLTATEGGDSFSPWDVLAHLVHGERVDWVPRLEIILEHGETRPFEPFDRYAHRDAARGRSVAQLLDQLEDLRTANLATLAEHRVGLELDAAGRHPEFGRVTVRQLLAAWAVHDLGHIRQVCRVLAKQYRDEVGPWYAYLRVLH